MARRHKAPKLINKRGCSRAAPWPLIDKTLKKLEQTRKRLLKELAKKGNEHGN